MPQTVPIDAEGSAAVIDGMLARIRPHAARAAGGGRRAPALLTRFESVTCSAVLEAVTDLATLRTMVVRGAPSADDATRAAASS
jgi:hypothetical protein